VQLLGFRQGILTKTVFQLRIVFGGTYRPRFEEHTLLALGARPHQLAGAAITSPHRIGILVPEKKQSCSGRTAQNKEGNAVSHCGSTKGKFISFDRENSVRIRTIGWLPFTLRVIKGESDWAAEYSSQ
jgi:hypothetical protein